MHGSFVNNDTPCHEACTAALQQRCADWGRFRLWTQIRSNCWMRGRTANWFFIQRSRCCDHNEYSVKILHAVRSAITAIAELLVYFMRYLETLLYHPMCVHVQMDNQVIVSDYTQMDRVLRDERQYILNIVKQVKKAGCNVLLVQKSILR